MSYLTDNNGIYLDNVNVKVQVTPLLISALIYKIDTVSRCKNLW